MACFVTRSLLRRQFGLALGGALLIVALLGSPAAQAQGDQTGRNLAGQTPAGFVQSIGDEAFSVLSNSALAPAARKAALQTLLESRFDIAAISRFVLGRHWRDTSENQRAEFAALFGDFVVATYGRHLDGFAVHRLKVGRAIDKKNRGVYVTSELQRSGENNLQVVWRLHKSAGEWRAVDVIVEGVSLALTHRSEVDSVIRNSRMAGLLDRMRALIAAAGGKQNSGAS